MCRIHSVVFFVAIRVNFCGLAHTLCVCARPFPHFECFVHALFHILHIFIYRDADCVSVSIFSRAQKETDKNIEVESERLWDEKSAIAFGLYKSSCEQNPCKSIDKPTWNVYEIQNPNSRTRRISNRGKNVCPLFSLLLFQLTYRRFRATESSLVKQKYVFLYTHSPAFIRSRYVNNNTQYARSFFYTTQRYESLIFCQTPTIKVHDEERDVHIIKIYCMLK